MIEIIIKNYLAEKLSMPVVLEVPADPPESFVLLEKTGSSRAERIDRAMLAIQSYAPSMYEAARLNERVKAAMDSAAELDAVSASRLNSDYNFTNTTTKRYRYQAVYDLVYYNE
jgi:hypothetical protein